MPEIDPTPKAPTTFMLDNEYRIVVTFPFLDRRSLVRTWMSAVADSEAEVGDPVGVYRAAAALVGRCSKIGVASGAEWRAGRDPLEYGTAVYDHLVSAGIVEGDDHTPVISAGAACFGALVASLNLRPTAEAVQAAAGESGPPSPG